MKAFSSGLRPAVIGGLIGTFVNLGPVYAQDKPALDDPATVVTVMQFTAKDASSASTLKQRMAAIRDFIRTQPGYVENVLLKNLSPDASPHFVGVSRWRTIKDWEALWLNPQMQALINAVNKVGTLTPGAFVPQK